MFKKSKNVKLLEEAKEIQTKSTNDFRESLIVHLENSKQKARAKTYICVGDGSGLKKYRAIANSTRAGN